MNINQFFEALASNNSRLFKEAELEKVKDNEVLKKVIFLALDPFTQFYIRKIPVYVTDRPVWHTLESALPKLDKLSKREITGNAAIEYLRLLLSEVSPGAAKVIERIIAKDLKCGASVSTVNKIWPGLIAEYPCMLCSQYEKKLVDKIKFPAYVQMKMDGMRFNAIVKDGKVEFRSRNGKEINLLGNLEQEFLALAEGVDCVFDGELMVMFDDDYQFADRQTGNGILNKAVKGTISEKEAAQVHATLWDIIPYSDFVSGKCIGPYSTRYEVVKHKVDQQVGPKRIWNVYCVEVQNIEEAQAEFSKLYADGYEGIILKDKNGIWENKRSKSQIKFKGELECDLKIVGIQEGTGKYAGLMGALVCESADGLIKVDIGSGFKDHHRAELFDESIIGKVIAIKYNERIKNKQGEHSLFLPIFLELREDKTEADHSDNIK